MMYELQKRDTAPSAASLGERLCGIIKKELQVDAVPAQPFAWLTFQDGNKLIEVLKKYVAKLLFPPAGHWHGVPCGENRREAVGNGAAPSLE